MSVARLPVLLTPDRRRGLAAVVLRGNLGAYDTKPALAQVVDQLADGLLQARSGQPTDDGWNIVADQLIDRFAHRTALQPHERSTLTCNV